MNYYFIKLKYFIDRGMKIKNVIVYVDTGDIYDESRRKIINGQVINEFDSFKNYYQIKQIKNPSNSIHTSMNAFQGLPTRNPSQYETVFLSDAHTDQDITKALGAYGLSLKAVKN